MQSSAEVPGGSFGRAFGLPSADRKRVGRKMRGGKKMAMARAMAMCGIGGAGRHATAARVFVPLIFLVVSLNLCHVDAAGRFTFPGGAGGTGMAAEKAASVALELTEATFNSTLLNGGTQYALVEFFASWCPACRRFKPEYDRVAKLFNPPAAVYPDQILVGTVDCAQEAALCKRFLIRMYPTMYFGPAVALAEGKGPENMVDQPKGFERVDPPRRSADGIVEWINGKISRSFQMIDGTSTVSGGGIQRRSQRYMQKIADIYDMEEAVAMTFNIIFNTVLDKNSRLPLTLFTSLVANHHPSGRCRKGAADLLWRMDELWPLVHEELQASPTHMEGSKRSGEPDLAELQQVKICGHDRPRGSWRSCQGSKPTSRGYSCGVWATFHSLAARLDDNEGGIWLQAIRAFMDKFFTCSSCRVHFLRHSENSTITTRRDAVLWFWKTHNIVNKRLAREDLTTGNGDPEYPKMNWPSKELCPTCRAVPPPGREGDWDAAWVEDEVYKFLIKFYAHPLGEDNIIAEENRKRILEQNEHDTIVTPDLDGLQKVDIEEENKIQQTQMDTSTAVPAGAAIAVAIASCAFGIVACWWRLQQKKRKYVLGHA